MNTKAFYQSKTFWIQVAAIVGALIPKAQEWLSTNPVEMVAVFAAINILVRFVTHGKISIFGEGGTTPPSASLTSASSALVLSLVVSGLAMAALASCSNGVKLDLGSDPNDGEFRTPLSGVVVRELPDGGAKAVIDGGTVLNWVTKVVRLSSGEDAGEVFLVPVGGGAKAGLAPLAQ